MQVFPGASQQPAGGVDQFFTLVEEVLLQDERPPVDEAFLRDEALSSVDGAVFVVADEWRLDGGDVLEALSGRGVTSSRMRWGTFWILQAGL